MSETGNEPEATNGSEEKTGSLSALPATWSYLFIHHKKTAVVREKLAKSFEVFIHTSIRYGRGANQSRKQECPTISGLIFVRGEAGEIQNFLSLNFPGLYLVKDCSTGKTAVISDDAMRSFMQISQVAPTRIRFMPHSFGYYAEGNTLVRITSGALAGMEGYRLRIARDKCLVTSLGGMTVAISGIYKDSFENLDEYVRLRRAQLQVGKPAPDSAMTVIQAQIDEGFFNPQDQMDVIAVVGNAEAWAEKARRAFAEKDYDLAAEIALFVLEEFGSRFQTLYEGARNLDLKEADLLCESLVTLLRRTIGLADVSVDLKEIIESGLETLNIRFPFLPALPECPPA